MKWWHALLGVLGLGGAVAGAVVLVKHESDPATVKAREAAAAAKNAQAVARANAAAAAKAQAEQAKAAAAAGGAAGSLLGAGISFFTNLAKSFPSSTDAVDGEDYSIDFD